MTDHDDAIRVSREITPADQRALAAQCTRCALRDSAGWLVAGAVAGVVVGVVTGAAVVPALVFTVVLAVLQVLAVRNGVRATYPVGTLIRTALTDHRLECTTGDLSLPYVTGVRGEGRVVRIDFDRDHMHLVPGTVDLDALRARAGAPAPEPDVVPGSVVVEVPPGLGARVARRTFVWQVTRTSGVLWAWALAALCLAVGQWAMATTVAVSQLGAILVQVSIDRRAFDRAFPPGVPLVARWAGRVLELRSTRGLSVVDLEPARTGAATGDLFVIRRQGVPPLAVPDVVVSDVVRRDLSRDI